MSYRRLQVLQLKYDLHVLMNGGREQAASQNDPRDFGNVMKVDTHIHLSAAMTSKHLLDFIRHKLRTASSDVVGKNKSGEQNTLEQVFARLGIDVESFTLNSLDTRADNTFQRFDHFNAKYNPFGKTELRDVFLKSNNAMGGKYYAELTQQLLHKMEHSKYVAAEYRVSVYGVNGGEWDELAKWVIGHRLYSDRQRWLIQIPRIYNIFRKSGAVSSFEGLLKNIFGPLFEVSRDPSSHPELHAFLNQVSGFDSVDDESKPERKFDDRLAEITPEKWTSEENPPYSYYSYYFWANIVSLNSLRASKGLKTFDFRPHCGESGDVDHLASSFLLATNISHGINLDKAIPLQYLYYLSQVGLAVSPLSNNALFLAYAINPFPKFFKRGLNVSLSTDDPLQFHHTEQPLIEEYATAAQKWELSDGDLSEIARNSILQSGFEHARKSKWLGERYLEEGVEGNDIAFSNVPDIRIAFRQDNLRAEKDYLASCVASIAAPTATSGVDIVSLPASSSAIAAFTDNANQVCKVVLSQPFVDASEQDACVLLQSGIQIKKKYSMPSLSIEELKSEKIAPNLNPTPHFFRVMKGVIHVFEGAIVEGKQFVATEPMVQVTEYAPFHDFEDDMVSLVQSFKLPQVMAFANARLRLLDNKFGFHTLLNGPLEKELMRFLPTDFAHVTKVDNHVRLQHSMLARHFIKFVKEKVTQNGDDLVVTSHGRRITLAQLYDALDIPIENLTVDALYVRTDSSLTHLEENSLYGHPTLPDLSSIAARGSPFDKISTHRFDHTHSNELRRDIDEDDGTPILRRKTSPSTPSSASSVGVNAGSADSGLAMGTGNAAIGGNAIEVIIDSPDAGSDGGNDVLASEIAKHLPTKSGSIRVSTRAGASTQSRRSSFGPQSPRGNPPVIVDRGNSSQSVDLATPIAMQAKVQREKASTALWHLYNLFLMSDNDIGGRYFAELAKEVIEKRQRNPQTMHEFRLIFTGKSRDEWDRLAHWMVKYDLTSYESVQWLIELPPTYSYLKRNGLIENLQDYFDNLFMPLLEVTRDPSSHPELAKILPNISGFYVPHIVQAGAEHKVDHMSPVSFSRAESPPHVFLMYYYWANLYSLNTFRKSKHLPTFTLRASTDANAHSLSKASIFALSSVMHTADLILRHQPGLTYLCYLTQIGLTVSPLSSITRAPRHYAESQFVGFFRQGLRVSLSSDNPLQLHMTNEPLNEEYAIASHMWKLSNCDLSEIARNSVVTSGFPYLFKCDRIGHNHLYMGVKGNEPTKTNVPNVRVSFREDCLAEELTHIKKSARASKNSSIVDIQAYFASQMD